MFRDIAWPVYTELLATLVERVDGWGRLFGEIQLGEKRVTVPGPPPEIRRPGQPDEQEKRRPLRERVLAWAGRNLGGR